MPNSKSSISGSIPNENQVSNGIENIKDSQDEINAKSTLEKLLEKVRKNAGEGKAEAFGAETVKKLSEVLQNQVF